MILKNVSWLKNTVTTKKFFVIIFPYKTIPFSSTVCVLYSHIRKCPYYCTSGKSSFSAWIYSLVNKNTLKFWTMILLFVVQSDIYILGWTFTDENTSALFYNMAWFQKFSTSITSLSWQKCEIGGRPATI